MTNNELIISNWLRKLKLNIPEELTNLLCEYTINLHLKFLKNNLKGIYTWSNNAGDGDGHDRLTFHSNGNYTYKQVNIYVDIDNYFRSQTCNDEDGIWEWDIHMSLLFFFFFKLTNWIVAALCARFCIYSTKTRKKNFENVLFFFFIFFIKIGLFFFSKKNC